MVSLITSCQMNPTNAISRLRERIMQSQDWLLILKICVQFLDFGNVQCILGFAQLPRLCRTCTHTFTHIRVQAHTLVQEDGKEHSHCSSSHGPPPHPSANRFRRTVATERVEQMVRREGELEERVPQGVRRGWGVVEIRYVAAIVFMCYVLELHSLCFNTQLYMHPGASLLVQV